MSEDPQYPEWYYANPIPGKKVYDMKPTEVICLLYFPINQFQHMQQVQMAVFSLNALRTFLGQM